MNEGILEIAGSSLSPVRLEPENSVPFADKWGGFRIIGDSTTNIHDAHISGATQVWKAFGTTHANSLEVDRVTVDSSTFGFEGRSSQRFSQAKLAVGRWAFRSDIGLSMSLNDCSIKAGDASQVVFVQANVNLQTDRCTFSTGGLVVLGGAVRGAGNVFDNAELKMTGGEIILSDTAWRGSKARLSFEQNQAGVTSFASLVRPTFVDNV